MRLDAIRGAVRAVLFLSLTAILLPIYPLVGVLGLDARDTVGRLWCRATCRILGLRVRASGIAFRACPTLVIANHVSYLDIVALGSFLGGTFIAKSEVAGWPLFGLIGRVTGTMFIRRHWRQALVQRNALAARMRAGESFILFAEGTSSNGETVLPFKTSLLSVTEPWVLDCPVAAQAVSVVLRRFPDGSPLTAASRDRYAWYGDMPFLPHLWGVLCGPGLEIDVMIHEPVLSWAIKSRKLLGRQLSEAISADLDQCRSRDDLPAASPASAAVPRAA